MNNVVDSRRIVYTPSEFAKDSLIYLQEAGELRSLKKHISSRNDLDSFLFLIVLEGNGTFTYQNREYRLNRSSCVFIDCRSGYSHSSDNWNIMWVHFYGKGVSSIYRKYLERNGSNIFISGKQNSYQELINRICAIAGSDDYIRDMKINGCLYDLLTLLMGETVYEESGRNTIYHISDIKDYIDEHYSEDLSLDSLSQIFYINKFYLTRLFKNTYGVTVNTDLQNRRITEAKKMLRFTDLSMEDIAKNCGIADANYFSRLFKKIEGMTPKEYRRMW